jgi:hypothetical protein
MANKTNPRIAQRDNTDVRNNKIMTMMNNMGKPVMASKQVSNAVKTLRSGNERELEKNLGSLNSSKTDSAVKLAASNKIVTSKKMGGSIKKK